MNRSNHNHRLPAGPRRLRRVSARADRSERLDGVDRNEVFSHLRPRLAWAHDESIPHRLFLQAFRDAESLAATTSFPHLVLPELVGEKVRAARQWNTRQQSIFERTSLSLAE